VARAVEPVKQELSDEMKAKHEASVKKYPWLNISESEYIISAVHRHLIGLFIPVALATFLVILTLVIMINYPLVVNSLQTSSPGTMFPAYGDVVLVCLLLVMLFVIGGYIAVWVYQRNTFFLTNESVIQEIQTSLFTKKEQTVNLNNIEDASFSQKGLIQSFFNYGSIRLSTQGDETTYRFHYVSNPKQQISLLNNAVENFKNGRPAED
ncbi:MAG: PH domain-containing protein, partial [Candidatus Saccharibacteria bacterium]